MPIPESKISILIPTYCYRDKVGRAVESALASGAGEIIVTDDFSRDGTMELLSQYEDPRLQVFENSANLGLWENHLAALNRATLPWIKFVQADDYLLPGGLAYYARAVRKGVTVVWGCPTPIDDDGVGTPNSWHWLDRSLRLSGAETLDICLYVGWLLGSPSHMMIRTDAVTRDPAAWITEISADLVIGSLAAIEGDVVLIPQGAIGQGTHAKQDAKTQSQARGLRRMVHSVSYLAEQPSPLLKRFAILWAAMNCRAALRCAVKAILLREMSLAEGLRLYSRIQRYANGAGHVSQGPGTLRSARVYRSSSSEPHDVKQVATMVREAVSE